MELAPPTTKDQQPSDLEADAFKRLYPSQYHERFFAEGIRPDGRPLGKARAVTLMQSAVSAGAEGSAAIKLGSTSILAGVRLEMYRPEGDTAGQGELVLHVEMAPFSSADLRQNRQAEAECVGSLTQRLTHVLGHQAVFDKRQLCIAEGKAAWRATVDIYVLDSDGSLLDACLLAAVAALADTKLPPVKQVSEGNYTRASADDATAPAASTSQPVQLRFSTLPLSVTCCQVKDFFLVDPTAEEEALAEARVTAVVDGDQTLRGGLGCGLYPAFVSNSDILRFYTVGRTKHLRTHTTVDGLTAPVAKYVLSVADCVQAFSKWGPQMPSHGLPTTDASRLRRADGAN